MRTSSARIVAMDCRNVGSLRMYAGPETEYHYLPIALNLAGTGM